jgi:hypothetical protein
MVQEERLRIAQESGVFSADRAREAPDFPPHANRAFGEGLLLVGTDSDGLSDRADAIPDKCRAGNDS